MSLMNHSIQIKMIINSSTLATYDLALNLYYTGISAH